MGVRLSIYAQVILGPVAIWAQYARFRESGERTISLILYHMIGKLLFCGIALFITATVGAKSTIGIDSVEGVIVLNLLWIINATILSLTAITYALSWSGWESDRQSEEQGRFSRLRKWWNIFPLGGIIQSLFLRAFGLWFWTNTPTNNMAYYWIFGRTSTHSSVDMSSILAVPGVNTVFYAIIAYSIPALIAATLTPGFKRLENKVLEYAMHAIALLAFLSEPIYLITSTEMVIKANSFEEGEIPHIWTLGDITFLLIAATTFFSIAKLTIRSWQSQSTAPVAHATDVNDTPVKDVKMSLKPQ
ncbi:hypothetical protein BDN70DRAFT_929044 [Pholiota conissans]|uniref:Uncharacterized protein n=1 Tax=Pholiota conissans TaxID=109636 RepID=A0A9P6D549_9AGAR|nr:hypothetical protein BDN70DRAFT_929044 [Pholiota conissans]